jgi:hypothetical protein
VCIRKNWIRQLRGISVLNTFKSRSNIIQCFFLKKPSCLLSFFSDMETVRNLFNSQNNVGLAGPATPENRIVNMFRICLQNFPFTYFSTTKTRCIYIVGYFVFTTKVTNKANAWRRACNEAGLLRNLVDMRISIEIMLFWGGHSDGTDGHFSHTHTNTYRDPKTEVSRFFKADVFLFFFFNSCYRASW